MPALTNNELAVLAILNECGLSTYQVALGMGFKREPPRDVPSERAYEAARKVLNRLKDQKGVTHTYGKWELTERGRIALGIAAGKDPKLARAMQ